MPSAIRFDKAKFKELLLHVTWKLQKDNWYGDIKLNKILYFCEFRAYGALGRPITGQSFARQPKGPVSTVLRPIRAEMESERLCAVQETEDHGKTRRKTIPLRKPNLTQFAAEEIAIVDGVIEDYLNHTADEISGVSHQELGWDVAALGEKIPYQTVFFSKPDLTQEEIDYGVALAARLG